MQPARLNGGRRKGADHPAWGRGTSGFGIDAHIRVHAVVHLLVLDVCRICGEKYAVRASAIPLAPGIQVWAEDANEAARKESAGGVDGRRRSGLDRPRGIAITVGVHRSAFGASLGR